MPPADDSLPPEVQAEVDKIKTQEGGNEPAPEPEIPQVEVEVAPKPLSRRQQAEQERAEQMRALEERATKATEIAERIAQQRQEDAQRLARMEELLLRGQQQQIPQQQAAPVEKDWRERADKARRKAEKALADGKMDEYHDGLRKAIRIEMEAEFGPRINEANQRANAFQQQQPQRMPDWVTAVESQFADVVMHPQGKNIVAALAQVEMAKTGRPIDAQTLMSAYARARTEITPEKGAAPVTEQRRQVLNGGPVNGSGRAAPAGGDKGPKVRVPANYKEIARAVGMSPEDYLRNAALMDRQ